jgi:antitoxin VapB
VSGCPLHIGSVNGNDDDGANDNQSRGTLMISLTPETEHLARLIAARIGTTPEQLLAEVVETRARELGVTPGSAARPKCKPSNDRMMEISDRFANRPVLDPRSPEEIIGYDEFGVPN